MLTTSSGDLHLQPQAHVFGDVAALSAEGTGGDVDRVLARARALDVKWEVGCVEGVDVARHRVGDGDQNALVGRTVDGVSYLCKIRGLSVEDLCVESHGIEAYRGNRVPCWCPITRAVDKLRLVHDDVASVFLADDNALCSDVDLSRENVVRLDKVGNFARGGGGILLVQWVVFAIEELARVVHLVLK